MDCIAISQGVVCFYAVLMAFDSGHVKLQVLVNPSLVPTFTPPEDAGQLQR